MGAFQAKDVDQKGQLRQILGHQAPIGSRFQESRDFWSVNMNDWVAFLSDNKALLEKKPRIPFIETILPQSLLVQAKSLGALEAPDSGNDTLNFNSREYLEAADGVSGFDQKIQKNTDQFFEQISETEKAPEIESKIQTGFTSASIDQATSNQQQMLSSKSESHPFPSDSESSSDFIQQMGIGGTGEEQGNWNTPINQDLLLQQQQHQSTIEILRKLNQHQLKNRTEGSRQPQKLKNGAFYAEVVGGEGAGSAASTVSEQKQQEFSLQVVQNDTKQQKKLKGKSLGELFNLKKHHKKNVTGKGIKIAIFDSGLAEKYLKENREIEIKQEQRQQQQTLQNLNYLQMLQDSDNGQIRISDGGKDDATGEGSEFEKVPLENHTADSDDGNKNQQTDLRVVKVIDFTHDQSTLDKIGHGTFITSVVGSIHKDCPGIAPDAEIYVFKVFTESRQSFTSWFLDAFNFVLDQNIDIVNLSNGSSDYLDKPFIEKINELTAHGVIVVSAIGNDGPFQGTLNNPGDLVNVIGVGSLDHTEKKVAPFSSRGITTWSLLDGFGIIKPDILTFGAKIRGLSSSVPHGQPSQCTVSQGTSVSCSIVSASVALALSQIDDSRLRKEIQNSAFIKEALIKSAKPLKDLSITEQGAGVFDLDVFMDLVQRKAELHKQTVYVPSLPLGNGIEIYPAVIDIRARQSASLSNSQQRGYKNTSGVEDEAVKQNISESNTENSTGSTDLQNQNSSEDNSSPSFLNLNDFKSSESDSMINKTERTQAYFDEIEREKNKSNKITTSAAEILNDQQDDERNLYFLPFSRQSMYASMMPISFNISVMNSESMISKIVDYQISLEKVKGSGRVEEQDFRPKDQNQGQSQGKGQEELLEKLEQIKQCINLELFKPSTIWPFIGNIRIQIRADNNSDTCQNLEETDLQFVLKLGIKNLGISKQRQREFNKQVHWQSFKFKFDFIKTPERNKRLLFDQFHNLKFPENGFVMRDSLSNFNHPFEWNGDHLHTNYVQMHQRLVEYGGYHVEILTEPFTCFDASNYGALLIVDPEDYFSKNEIIKLRRDIEQLDLSLIILADWYSQKLFEQSSFYNNNTFEEWHPVMAGSNVGTINALLEPYHIALGDQRVMSGDFVLDKRRVVIDSGSEIVQFPKGGYLVSAQLYEEPDSVAARFNLGKVVQTDNSHGAVQVSGEDGLEDNSIQPVPQSTQNVPSQIYDDIFDQKNGSYTPTIGIFAINDQNSKGEGHGGRIILMSDSDCVDSNSNYYTPQGFSQNKSQGNTSSPASSKCFWLMHQFADIATAGQGRNMTLNTSLLNNKFRLPADFTALDYQAAGSIKKVTADDRWQILSRRHLTQTSTTSTSLSHFDRSIHLNSDDQTCRKKSQMRGGIEESKVDIKPYWHVSDVASGGGETIISVWEQTPNQNSQSSNNKLLPDGSSVQIGHSQRKQEARQELMKIIIDNITHRDGLLGWILYLGVVITLFALLSRKLLICCLRNNNRLRLFIFKHTKLKRIQRYIINMDTTRNYPLGHVPSRPPVRAPHLFKVDRSMSTDSSERTSSNEEHSSQSGGSEPSINGSVMMDQSFSAGSVIAANDYSDHNLNYLSDTFSFCDEADPEQTDDDIIIHQQTFIKQQYPFNFQ